MMAAAGPIGGAAGSCQPLKPRVVFSGSIEHIKASEPLAAQLKNADGVLQDALSPTVWRYLSEAAVQDDVPHMSAEELLKQTRAALELTKQGKDPAEVEHLWKRLDKDWHNWGRTKLSAISFRAAADQAIVAKCVERGNTQDRCSAALKTVTAEAEQAMMKHHLMMQVADMNLDHLEDEM